MTARGAALARLKLEEGERRLTNGNHELYQDSVGKWTIGWGYNLSDNGLPDDVAELLLERALADAEAQLARKLPWTAELDDVRRYVLVDMLFNMGWAAFSGFRQTLAAVKARQFARAAMLMLQSKWARQTGTRAEQLSRLMEFGQ